MVIGGLVLEFRYQICEHKMLRQGKTSRSLICVYFILTVTSTIVKCSPIKALGEILLSQSFQACKSVDFRQDRFICDIHSEEDENNLVCLGIATCKMPVTLCPDDSINKTCYPFKDDNYLSYQCICHCKRRAESIVPVIEWTTWMISTQPYHTFRSERSLIVPSLDWTVLQEFSHYRPSKVYIISNDKLSPSSVYSASSVHSDVYDPYKASIDTTGEHCSWASKQNPSWLQMTLPTEYVVFGAYIKQRCDYLQYPTRVKITRSADGASWQTVIESEDLSYDFYDTQGSCSVWFAQTYRDRFWRIHVLAFYHHASMRADLIGYKWITPSDT